MNKLVRNLAFAAMLAVPATAQAQIGTASLTLNGHPYNVSGGGGFSTSVFNFTPTAAPVQDFAGFVVWCIDRTRTISPAGSYNFDVYTFDGFAASGLGNRFLSDPDGPAMNRIASLLNPFQNDVNSSSFPQPAGAARVADQAAIWDNFDGLAAAGNSGFDSSDWYVLFNDRNQTLAFRWVQGPITVPEPSSVALLGMGLSGVLVAARRRRKA